MDKTAASKRKLNETNEVSDERRRKRENSPAE